MTSFTNIIVGLRNNKWIGSWILVLVALGATISISAFQLETPNEPAYKDFNSILRDGESGGLNQGETLPAVWALFHYDYNGARNAVRNAPASYPEWFAAYAKALPEVAAPLVHQSSEHFDLYTPPGQEFLGDYALPALEKASDYFEKIWGVRPAGKIRVEIYPNKEAFSQASTLSTSTLESSGAIGICKFHRLMILTPKALPIGYRWLDALTHEYTHLMVNTLSEARAELWIHEGIARYFETAPRANPPLFLTPEQKSTLKQATTEDKLIPYARMSPSLVYLKDQNEVSLAFSEVAYSVSRLVDDKGTKRLANFLRSLRTLSFAEGFHKNYGQTPDEFEKEVHANLAKEKWPLTKGAMTDEVRFTPLDESEVVGADAQAEMRLGDQMRMRGRPDAALIEYENALQQEPDNAVLLLKAARASMEMGDKKAAREFLERAVEKNPNYVTPYIDLALLVEPARAEKLYLVAAALNPFDPRIHQGLVRVHTRDDVFREREAQIVGQLNSGSR